MTFWMKTTVLVIGIFALSACDRSHDEAHEPPRAGAPAAPHDDGHGHDHPHGGPDHSHDDPHTETFFGPDAANDGEHDDDDEHAHDDEEPHEH
jgi:sirohydrochlorin cobaltochelatase